MRQLWWICIAIYVGLTSYAQAQQTNQVLCDDYNGVRFGVYNSPQFGGHLVISPVWGAVGPEIPLVVVNNPVISMAFINPMGFGLLIAADGGLVAKQGYQYFPVGRCAILTVGPGLPMPPPRALLFPPPNLNSSAAQPILDQMGRDVGGIAVAPVDGVQHVPMNATEAQATQCAQEYGVNQDGFMRCMANAMLTDQQRRAVACAESDDSKLDKAGCLAKVANPAAGRVVDIIAKCTEDDEVDWDCVAKAGLPKQASAAYKCVTSGDGNDDDQLTACMQGMGANPQITQTVSMIRDCYDSGSDATDYATCALSHSGDKRVATAAKCIEEQAQSDDFSYVGAGICYAGNQLDLNPELKIAVECVAESGGQPYAYAGCVGGRLTARELSKCFTDGVGGDGCFGRNNEIVAALRRSGIDVEDLANPNGEAIKAWDTASNDLRNGPGPNNDIVRFANNAVQGFAGPNNDIVRTVNNAVNDVTHGPGQNNDIVRAANAASAGVNHAANEAGKAIGRVFGW